MSMWLFITYDITSELIFRLWHFVMYLERSSRVNYTCHAIRVYSCVENEKMNINVITFMMLPVNYGMKPDAFCLCNWNFYLEDQRQVLLVWNETPNIVCVVKAILLVVVACRLFVSWCGKIVYVWMSWSIVFPIVIKYLCFDILLWVM
jgi:hypothetical protein